MKFMGVDVIAPEGVLKPRRETETLGNHAVQCLLEFPVDRTLRVIDMCCGSGNLAVAIAARVAHCKVWAADLKSAAMQVAKFNCELNALADRIEVRQGDLFAAFTDDRLEGTIDMIVCNPPYISTSRLDGPKADLLVDEPREAFDGGPFGISVHQRLVREAVAFLKPGGFLLCEFGEGQARQVGTLIARSKAYHPAEFIADANGVPRVAVARRFAPAGEPNGRSTA
ncbi:N5-glutamine methyltransferase family protein [Rhizobium setariae]|nr:HemK/PrmC family methyltransferase [Rhizobium setariae]